MSRGIGAVVVVLGLMLCGATGIRAQQPAPCRDLPPNLRVTDTFRPLVRDLVGRSATLRRQCAALADAPTVHVTITSPARTSSQSRARAVFHRSGTGRLGVHIEIPTGSDYPELLAHELEHVLEQIEGVDLSALARRRRTGVHQVGAGTYETARATAAGRAAVRELSEEPVPVAFAGRVAFEEPAGDPPLLDVRALSFRATFPETRGPGR